MCLAAILLLEQKMIIFLSIVFHGWIKFLMHLLRQIMKWPLVRNGEAKILEKNIFSYENDFLTIHPLFMHYDFKATIAIAKKLSYVYRNRHMKLRHYG